MPDASPRWTLPGPFIPYLIVMQGDAEARDASRRVPAETALPQLDNWAAVRGDLLQEMELALREPTGGKEPPAPLPCKPGMNQQLKSRLTALLQAGRLMVLKAAPVAPAAGAKAAPVPTRKVTYTFDFTTAKEGLNVPYAAAIDGVVVGKAGRLECIEHKQPFTLEVPVGSTVSLFLNSDAHPDHRQNPVYGVSPRERDVQVTITEKTGLKDVPSDVPTYDDKASKAKGRDVYTALLTGGIWMKVSYRYSEEDARGLMPTTTLAGIRDAVLSIYRGEGLPASQKALTVECTLPAPADKKAEPETRTTLLELSGSNNPNQNIQDFVLQRDGLTRVHPRAYLAVLEAALKTKTPWLSITSNWRPMMGSKAHRLGLGLDVGALLTDSKTEILLNEREALSDSTKKGGALVSAKERETYGAYLTARSTSKAADAQAKTNSTAVRTAATALGSAQKELENAKKTKKGVTPDANRLEKLSGKVAEAMAELDKATKAQQGFDLAQSTAATGWETATALWRTELEADDPSHMRSFREALMAHPFVGQLFDPWYIDFNTRDKVAAELNDQCGGLQKVHNNHLHITVAEPLLMRG